ncbi:hypothetical protein CASFOL_014785 [Castilleja foliolosa]|uniref:PIPK domain-containing protein n=1 Tax=Castilleja foliolosa TaxID=1961234 RepID=A0ABD3DDN9_9LAMI
MYEVVKKEPLPRDYLRVQHGLCRRTATTLLLSLEREVSKFVRPEHELVLGIIDFMRQYTWDKHLETWVKASGILGGPKNASPTVISPKQYKRRFRKAMTTYFLMVPDQWSPPTIVPSKSQTDLSEEKNVQSTISAEVNPS